MAKTKSVCIMCGKERQGLEVKEDNVIGAMRWIKRNITKNSKNYNMVVCKEDFLAYKKKRDGYERKQIMYVGLGLLFMLLLLLFASGRYLGAILYGLGITAFMYLLSLLSYMPSLKVRLEPPKQRTDTGLNNTK